MTIAIHHKHHLYSEIEKKKKIVYIPRRQSGTCTVPYMRWMPSILHQRVALWPLSTFSNFLCVTTIICGCPGLSRAVYTTFQGRTWQSGTCKHIIYALDANYIASACSPITPLELQQLFICHTCHMWLSRTVPCCIYTIPRWDMTDGDSLGQCVCRLWYGITSWNSSMNI